MTIDPKKPSVGVPPLTRQGLHDNFKEALERINEFRGRLEVLEGGGGGSDGPLQRIKKLEEVQGKMADRVEMHDGQINAAEERIDKNELLSIENRQRIRELEQKP